MRTLEDRVYDAPLAARPGLAPGTVAQLAAAPLFRDIDRLEIERILAVFDEQTFNSGHRITLEGLRGSDFYVITQGSATVSIDGRPRARLQPGDFFGEIAVLGDGHRSATVSAETRLRCLVLANNALERLLIDHPQLGVNVLREVVARFREVSERPPSRVSLLRR